MGWGSDNSHTPPRACEANGSASTLNLHNSTSRLPRSHHDAHSKQPDEPTNLRTNSQAKPNPREHPDKSATKSRIPYAHFEGATCLLYVLQCVLRSLVQRGTDYKGTSYD